MRSILLSLVLLVGLKAHSFDQELYFSIMAGMGQVDTDVSGVSFDPAFNLGFRGGLVLNDQWTAGVFYLRSDNESSTTQVVNNVTFNFATDFNPLMVEFSYYMNKVKEQGLYFSGLAGLVSLGGNDTSNELGLGAVGGYNLMINENNSFSPQLVFVKAFGSDDKSGILISALVNYSYWF